MKALAVLAAAVTVGVAFGFVGWMVAGGGAACFILLMGHRVISRIGLVRVCRLVGAWCWSAAYGIEEHHRRMQEAVDNINNIETGTGVRQVV